MLLAARNAYPCASIASPSQPTLAALSTGTPKRWRNIRIKVGLFAPPPHTIHFFGGFGKKFADGEWLSGDAENNARYHADPYCKFVCSNNFFASFFRGLAGLYKKDACPPPDLPILLLSGKSDPVGDMGAGVLRLEKYYRGAGVQDVTVHLIEGSRHEFLNERAHAEEGVAAVLGFLERLSVRTPAAQN